MNGLSLCVLCCLFPLLGQCCIELSGIGNGSSADDVYSLDYIKNNSWPLDSVWFTFYRPLVVGNLENRETPIGIRASLYISLAIYNVLSYYDDTAIEFWARKDIMDSRRRCNYNNTNSSELFEYHRSIAMGYTMVWTIPYFLDEGSNTSINLLTGFGLDYDICDHYIDSCNDISTPWGIANAVFNEIVEYSSNDGFNADGSSCGCRAY